MKLWQGRRRKYEQADDVGGTTTDDATARGLAPRFGFSHARAREQQSPKPGRPVA